VNRVVHLVRWKRPMDRRRLRILPCPFSVVPFALLTFPLICLVTSGDGRSAAIVREAAAAGVDLVQIREPLLESGALHSLTREAVNGAAGTACQIVVNDRLDVAVAAGAAGVHLRADSFPASRVREVAPKGFLIGRSVHEPAEAVAATAQGGCDYLIFGTVFPSSSKPPGHQVAGLRKLQEVCGSTDLPVIAIGGISVENAADAIVAGAHGVAAIDLFRRCRSVRSLVSQLRQRFDTPPDLV
jgi:thiamine-phosphate diphosphorylase